RDPAEEAGVTVHDKSKATDDEKNKDLAVDKLGKNQTEVKLKGLKLELGDWIPKEEIDEIDGYVKGQGPTYAGADPADDKTIRWTWYQLARQGYFPRPRVTAPPPHAT